MSWGLKKVFSLKTHISVALDEGAQISLFLSLSKLPEFSLQLSDSRCLVRQLKLIVSNTKHLLVKNEEDDNYGDLTV